MKEATCFLIRLSLAVLTIAVLVTQFGCGEKATAKSKAPDNEAAPSALNAAYTPVLIAVLEDQSGSMKAARTLPLREEQLRELLVTLRKTTGELALGFIGEA